MALRSPCTKRRAAANRQKPVQQGRHSTEDPAQPKNIYKERKKIIKQRRRKALSSKLDVVTNSNDLVREDFCFFYLLFSSPEISKCHYLFIMECSEQVKFLMNNIFQKRARRSYIF